NIIAVANSTRNDLLSASSNYGRLSVDIAAPGSAIRSTISQNAYASYSGTSMASPHVAGLAALLKSYNPNWTNTELKNRILYRSDPISSMAGLTLTGARINAARALSQAQALSLSIRAGEGGTTQPAPGNYTYQNVTVVTMQPLPNPHFRFLLWTGNVPAGQSTADPLRLTVYSDIMIQANFERIIYPPRQLTGQMALNRSLSQKEYINGLRWQADPDNIDIDRYKVYIFEAGTWRLLQLLNNDTFEFQVRNVDGKTAYRYGVSAQNSLGREGERAVVDIQ
ncbi:MAG: S8 family serine peptidase, partial [Candidatus Aminicenantes bacterium]|nr:S8 family serine peptidase [Candidatus Aminicenantes bacterium]